MKRIFFVLSIILFMFFVSCEKDKKNIEKQVDKLLEI